MSSIYDICEDDIIEIYMPTERGKILPLPTDQRYEFVFVTDSGLYQAVGLIQERCKRNSVYLFRISLMEPLKKLQRREYYRLECSIPVTYEAISEEAAQRLSMDEVFKKDMPGEEKAPDVHGAGIILDISGGGARMVCPVELQDVTHLLLRFSLEDDGQTEIIDAVGALVRFEKKSREDMYCYSLQFLYKNKKDQERIIHYIFRIQRKMREKEQG